MQITHGALLQREQALSWQQQELQQLQKQLATFNGLPADMQEAHTTYLASQAQIEKLTADFDRRMGACGSPW